MSKPVASKKKEGQYCWRVRRKIQEGDTPWKSGGPMEIMEVVMRRLDALEQFEATTQEIERRIDILDKNILAVAKLLMPQPPKEPTPPPSKPEPEMTIPKPKTDESLMPRPPGAAPPAESAPPPEPILIKAAPSPVLAAAGMKGAGVKPGIKHETLKREQLATTGTLLGEVQPPAAAVLPQKVTVVGAGPVGVNLAFAILNQGVASEIALVDADEKRLQAEAMDMQYGMGFVKNSKVQASTDIAISANSRLVVLTVGQGDGKMPAAELAKKNIAAFKVIIPKILAKSPNCVLLVVSNPVDVMTYAAWKISGLPPHRVIGSGTNLDSNRFRRMIADKLKLNSEDCHGWIIGEQGHKSIPVWSGVHVAGVSLKSLNPAIGSANDKENWSLCHQEVIANAGSIAGAKRSASMAIAMSLTSLVRSLLHNNRQVFPVCTMVKGYHGLAEEVFLSLPCVLGDHGVCDVIKQTLAPEETKMLQESSTEVKKILTTLQF